MGIPELGKLALLQMRRNSRILQASYISHSDCSAVCNRLQCLQCVKRERVVIATEIWEMEVFKKEKKEK